jgi:hypothetical protein
VAIDDARRSEKKSTAPRAPFVAPAAAVVEAVHAPFARALAHTRSTANRARDLSRSVGLSAYSPRRTQLAPDAPDAPDSPRLLKNNLRLATPFGHAPRPTRSRSRDQNAEPLLLRIDFPLCRVRAASWSPHQRVAVRGAIAASSRRPADRPTLLAASMEKGRATSRAAWPGAPGSSRMRHERARHGSACAFRGEHSPWNERRFLRASRPSVCNAGFGTGEPVRASRRTGGIVE